MNKIEAEKMASLMDETVSLYKEFSQKGPISTSLSGLQLMGIIIGKVIMILAYLVTAEIERSK